MRYVSAEEVRSRLTSVRGAMIALSRGRTRQLLRPILPLDDGRLIASMPGAMGENDLFGAKLISFFPENLAKGLPSRQGVVLLFDAADGAPIGSVEVGELAAIRTTAASAVSTDILARKDACRLAIQSKDQVTVYKSLGHVVQDLAAASALMRSGGERGEFQARGSSHHSR